MLANQYTFANYLKRFWLVFAFGLFRTYVRYEQGLLDLNLIPIGLVGALLVNYLIFLAWRAWNLRSAPKNPAANVPNS
jgi:hypothetical protein